MKPASGSSSESKILSFPSEEDQKHSGPTEFPYKQGIPEAEPDWVLPDPVEEEVLKTPSIHSCEDAAREITRTMIEIATKQTELSYYLEELELHSQKD